MLPPSQRPLSTMCLSPQKEGASQTARSKTLGPALPEKKAQGSSESSDEELPAGQVGRPSLGDAAGSELGGRGRAAGAEGGSSR